MSFSQAEAHSMAYSLKIAQAGASRQTARQPAMVTSDQ